MIIYIQWVIWIDLSYLDCKWWSIPRCIQWVIISSLTMIQKKHQFRWNHQTSPSVFSWGPSPDGPPDGPPGLSRTSFGSSAPCPNLEPNSAHQCRRDRDFRLNGLRQKTCWRTFKSSYWLEMMCTLETKWDQLNQLNVFWVFLKVFLGWHLSFYSPTNQGQGWLRGTLELKCSPKFHMWECQTTIRFDLKEFVPNLKCTEGWKVTRVA